MKHFCLYFAESVSDDRSEEQSNTEEVGSLIAKAEEALGEMDRQECEEFIHNNFISKVCSYCDAPERGVIMIESAVRGELLFWCVGAVLNKKQLKEVCRHEEIEIDVEFSVRLFSKESNNIHKNFLTFYTGSQAINNLSDSQGGNTPNVEYTLRIDHSAELTEKERSLVFFYAMEDLEPETKLYCDF